MAGAKCIRTGRPPKNWSRAPIAINQTVTAPPPLPPAHPTIMRADMLKHASHLLHQQVKSIGHCVIEAMVHHLGYNIFGFIWVSNLCLVH